MERVVSFMEKYMAGVDKTDSLLVLGYSKAEALAHVLREAGDNLTRENIMKHATNLRGVKSDVLLEVITLNTTPDAYSPLHEMRMMPFKAQPCDLLCDLHTSLPT